MTSFTDVYTNLPINPSVVAFNPLTISVNTTLSWPSVAQEGDYIAAGIMNITATTTGLILEMPDATQVSPGQSVLFSNVGSNTFTLTDNSGNTIVSIAAGQVRYVYLINNTSTNGSWGVILFGATSASVNASALAGAGLLAIGSTLNQNSPITAISSVYTLSVGDRANTIRNTGGTFVYSVQPSATLGNGWYAQVKNSGTGSITITPNGSETIDGNMNLVLNPGDSVIIASDGSNLYSLFKTSNITNTYSRLVKSVAGNSNVTLTSTEAAFSILSFTGTLTGNINIIAPTVVNEWIVENNTSGAFNATFKTTAGSGIVLGPTTGDIIQGAVNPAYCDGTNIRLSISVPSASITGVVGGTGIVVGTTAGVATVSISSTGVTANSYGGTSSIPTFTVNNQGQLTAASSVSALMTTANFVADSVTNSVLNLMPASTLKVNITATPAQPTDTAISPIFDALFTSSQGSLLTRTSSVWGVLSPGTSGQYLQTLGPAANPQWAPATGKLIQRAYASNNTRVQDTIGGMAFSSAVPTASQGTQFVSVSFTPTSTTNIIRVRVTCQGNSQNAGRFMTALFFNGGNAVAVASGNTNTSSMCSNTIIYNVVSGTTSAIAISANFGEPSANDGWLNGNSGGIIGGCLSSMEIEEVTP